ncbi:MAG: agmatinase [bacterium]
MKFLEIEREYYNYEKAKYVVIPCSHEATTTYGKGTQHGPAAILKASQQVETFDIEFLDEPYRQAGIFTKKDCRYRNLRAEVKRTVLVGKVPVILGGEHSLTVEAVKGVKERHPYLSVLQLDAHADLRDKYRGSKNSHACVMRRVLEVCPAVQAGIRSISVQEWEWARDNRQVENIHFAPNLKVADILHQLTQDVYITIDVDVFDPSIIPATGTPEPGGLNWYEVINILRGVCRERNVVGFDVVELSPRLNDVNSDFTVAKLVYKLIGLINSAGGSV